MPTNPSRSVAARLASAALAALLLAGCARHDEQAEAAAVTPTLVKLTPAQLQHIQLYTVAQTDFHRTVEANGVVDYDNDQATSVLAPISGPVTRLLVNPGQQVKAGDVLATVESPDYAAAIGAYAKALATAKTNRQLADADRDLAQHNGVSAREAQQAQTDAVNAEADRDAALKALVSLNVDAGTIREIQAGRTPHFDGKIRAPLTGTVVERLITPGQLLQAGTTPAFTVANLSKVWVMAQVASSDLANVAVGDPVTVETGVDGQTMTGAVDNVAALVNPDTRAVLTRVVVPNPGGALKKQMYVRVHIQSRKATSGLLVPVAAVLRDAENLPFVYVDQPSGGFARAPVTLGQRSGDMYEIRQGLRPGDRVVTDGGVFLQFMQTQ